MKIRFIVTSAAAAGAAALLAIGGLSTPANAVETSTGAAILGQVAQYDDDGWYHFITYQTAEQCQASAKLWRQFKDAECRNFTELWLRDRV